MNASQLTGYIREVTKVGNSLLVIIQYGPIPKVAPKSRGSKRTNMVSVRVPQSLLTGRHADEVKGLAVGDWVEVYGRVQGVEHRRTDRSMLQTEVVVSRITRPEYVEFDDPEAEQPVAEAS